MKVQPAVPLQRSARALRALRHLPWIALGFASVYLVLQLPAEVAIQRVRQLEGEVACCAESSLQAAYMRSKAKECEAALRDLIALHRRGVPEGTAVYVSCPMARQLNGESARP